MVVDQNAEPPVGSIDKALALLELLAEAGPDGMALRDVVETSGLNKASAHRTLQALQHRGFAEQDTNQRYRLGSRPALLVERFLREENLPTLFRPTLLAICQEVQELVHLGILEGRNVLYLDKVEPDRTLRVWSRVGRQVSVLTTALGRAMVALAKAHRIRCCYRCTRTPSHGGREISPGSRRGTTPRIRHRTRGERGRDLLCGRRAAEVDGSTCRGEHHRTKHSHGRRPDRRPGSTTARSAAGLGAARFHGSAAR